MNVCRGRIYKTLAFFWSSEGEVLESTVHKMSLFDQILFTFDLQHAQVFLYECLDVYTLHTSQHRQKV
jgi:hypothetical protein